MSIAKITGMETEYGITGSRPGDPQLWSAEIVQAYESWAAALHCSPGVGNATDRMLPNGARLYVDHGHPEYSTPECLSAASLVAADKAGEWLLARLSKTVQQHGHTIRIYKNNRDNDGNTYGCHENYLIAAPQFVGWMKNQARVLVNRFLPFLVTRPIFCGSGYVDSTSNPQKAEYQITQRADSFESLVGPETMARRPLINTRDEPHADPGLFRRLHVIVGDANMSEWSCYLKTATTQLVLAMLEDDWVLPDVALAEPLSAARLVSRDLSLGQPLDLANGKRATALEIQWRYLMAAEGYVTQVKPSPDFEVTIKNWRRVLETLASEPRRLNAEIDWLIKLTLVEELAGGLESPRAREIDIKYHDIDPELGIFNIWKSQGLVRGFLTQEAIENLLMMPPEDTRAYARGKIIAHNSNQLSRASWDQLSYNNDEIVRLPDPLKGSRAEFEACP